MLATTKKILYFLSISLVRVILYLAIISTVIVIAFGNEDSLKQALRESDAYDQFVPALIEENRKLPVMPGSLPYDDPEIVAIITSSFTTQDIQNATEEFIRGAYAWLEQEAPFLTFRIDFTRNKQALAAGIAEYAFDRLRSLPFCSVPPTEVDPLTTDCQPTNVDLESAQQSYEQQIFESTTFLEDPVLTEEDLPRNDNNESITDKYPSLPTVFTWARRAPYILGTVLVLIILEIILFSSHKRRSMRSLSKTFMNSGLSLLVIPILFSFVLPTITRSFDFNNSTGGTSQLFSDVSDTLVRSIDRLLIVSGTIILLTGLAMYAAESLTRPKNEYNKLARKTGLSNANGSKPKDLKNKLNESTVPLQTSNGPKKKQQSKNTKYRKLKTKKDF